MYLFTFPYIHLYTFFMLWATQLNLVFVCLGSAGRVRPFLQTIPKKRPLRVDLRSFLQIIYDIGTEFLIFHCFATKMLFLFCKSMIPVRFCTIFPLHSCAGIKTRFKALLKTQYLTLGPNFYFFIVLPPKCYFCFVNQ